jgi:hypothetical protein
MSLRVSHHHYRHQQSRHPSRIFYSPSALLLVILLSDTVTASMSRQFGTSLMSSFANVRSAGTKMTSSSLMANQRRGNPSTCFVSPRRRPAISSQSPKSRLSTRTFASLRELAISIDAKTKTPSPITPPTPGPDTTPSAQTAVEETQDETEWSQAAVPDVENQEESEDEVIEVNVPAKFKPYPFEVIINIVV